MKTKMLALITAALCFAPPAARAASDYLLELDGIKGESRDEDYSDSIQVLSWSWSCSNPPPSSTVPTGSVVFFTGLEISAPVSAASPQLLMACATGKRIPKAILHVRKEGTLEEYFMITLTDVMVSSWATSSSGGTPSASATDGDPPPTESFSINFTKIEFKYTPFNSDAAPVTGTAEIAPRP